MTDGQSLFAVFALLYLAECLRLVPSASWMAAGAEGSPWAVIRPWSRFQIAGGSPLLLSALPPLRAHAQALPWLFVPGQDALDVRVTDGMHISLPWQSLSPQAEDSTLHLGAGVRVRLASPAHAQMWAFRIAEWRDLPADERRSAFLQHARASLDTASAGRAAIHAAHITRPLRLQATLVFVWCFGVISIVYRHYGDSLAVLAAAGVLLLMQILQAWLFLRVTRDLKALIPHRFWRALGIALLPQLAMRAADAPGLAGPEEPPHPLAWRSLLKHDVWLRTARQFWREARYVPGWSQSTPLPPAAEALRIFFEAEGIAEEEYDPPCPAQQPFCPRCGAGYQDGIATCSSCGGVELRPAAAAEIARV